jgi:5'-deoxynucleotidase YfbR-like HD superfamily hydrolase
LLIEKETNQFEAAITSLIWPKEGVPEEYQTLLAEAEKRNQEERERAVYLKDENDNLTHKLEAGMTVRTQDSKTWKLSGIEDRSQINYFHGPCYNGYAFVLKGPCDRRVAKLSEITDIISD